MRFLTSLLPTRARRRRQPGADGVTGEDIAASIEMILGRKPWHGAIDYHLKLGFANRRALGEYMIGTAEFQARYTARFGRTGDLARPISMFLGDRVLTLTHRGQLIYLAPSDVDLTPSILLGGTWEPHIEGVIVAALKPGDTAIDVGSNVGYHTLAIAQAVGATGQVHAFEANPEVMRLLRATMFVNSCQWVHLHDRAALDHPGTITLASAPGHYGSGNVMLGPSPDYDALYSTRTEVAAVTLDDELGDRLGPVDLMHLDIEGSEPRALRGARALIERSPQLKIVTEWSVAMMSGHGDVGEFVAWLAGLGFRFWYIEEGGKLTPVTAEAALTLPFCDLYLSRDDPG